ncbi:hypothetical protein L2D08_22755 [Domibacillus sp. PGB-M46]|uniref:hypothetical protein n=1 Tax=Domibacillus sp. PGB-M46 TaxID=2910255 RepID=UPI001F5A5F1D|nr:hypothetical protein [Domibacillus sp. PGB-M46]MCI2257140.1 hypothetical protein [Domibacillus sp. PGB-M46]
MKAIVDTVIIHRPQAGKFVKANWKEVATIVGVAGADGKKVNNYRKNEKVAKQDQGKIYFRKTRYADCGTQILVRLHKKGTDIFQYKLGVEQFIK